MRASSSLALFGTIALMAYVVGCSSTSLNIPGQYPKPTKAPVSTPTPVATPTPVTTPTPYHSPTPIPSPTPYHSPTPVPSSTPTAVPTATPSTTPTPVTTPSPMYTQLSKDYTLSTNGQTITLPPDQDASGSMVFPAYYENPGDVVVRHSGATPMNASSVELELTESNTPISGAPAQTCAEPLYWYVTLFFNGPVSDSTTFESSHIPVKFTSPTLITAGHQYGLCVQNGDVKIQDDFTASPGGTNPVSPSGDTVSLTIVIPSWMQDSFQNQLTIGVYFERQ